MRDSWAKRKSFLVALVIGLTLMMGAWLPRSNSTLSIGENTQPVVHSEPIASKPRSLIISPSEGYDLEQFRAIEKQIGQISDTLGCLVARFELTEQEPWHLSQVEKLRAIGKEVSEISERLGRLAARSELTEQQARDLSHLESILASESSWPKSNSGAEALYSDFGRLMGSMPLSVQREYAPRLKAVMWGIEAFRALRPVESSMPNELSDRLSSLLDQVPENAPEILLNFVKQTGQSASVDADNVRRTQALTLAKKAISGDAVPDIALAGLEGIEGDEAGGLREQLKGHIIKKKNDENCAILQSTLEQAKNQPTDRLRQAGIGRVQDTAIGVLLDLSTDAVRHEDALVKVRSIIDSCQVDLDGIATRVSRNQQRDYAAKLHEYQDWALQRIVSFNKAYETEYKKIREPMINYLLPINSTLLEPPIARLFQEAYEKGWGYLSAEDRLEVAKRSVVIEKKSVD